MVALRVIVFLAGLVLTAATMLSVIKTFILPRSAPDWLTRGIFRSLRGVFGALLRSRRTYESRDSIMAFFAPIGLLILLAAWLVLLWVAYAALFWATGVTDIQEALRMSGSSFTTLGFEGPVTFFHTVLSLSEASLGLILVALLISYLPTIYGAFTRREAAVKLLEVRAGSPPSAVEMLIRYHRIHGLDRLGEQWQVWEQWFADIDESHTSLASLVFFRSPRPEHSWTTAAGAILDAASLSRSLVDIPADPRADLCIRAGFLAMRHISEFFEFKYNPDPHYPADSISIRREEFDEACRALESEGVPLKPDREQAWQDFAGWRVNYDQILLTLCQLTMAPYAPWSSDRAGTTLPGTIGSPHAQRDQAYMETWSQRGQKSE